MKKSQSQGMDRRTFLKASSAISLGAMATLRAPGDISAHPSPKMNEKNIGEMMDVFPHMLFGTDYPYPGDVAHESIIKAIGRMNITEQAKASIFSKNARQLLKLA
jgi:predicted TIM-barrel fold metal-dependent hydrolase